MDCKLKTCSQVWLIALFIPTLLWGYGKSAINLAQNEEDATIGVGGENRTSNGKSSGAAKQAANKDADSSSSSLNTQVSVQASNPIAEVNADNSKAGTAETKESKKAAAKGNDGGSNTPEVDKDGNPGFVEPDLTNGTYNQVRAKKPSIPSRFDGQDGYDTRNENGNDLNGISIFGLLGIPTVVFGLLFFVMWGIISGRIQRIMF